MRYKLIILDDPGRSQGMAIKHLGLLPIWNA